MRKRLLLCFMAALMLCSLAGSAMAGTLVWGNNATFGNVTLEAFDMATGAVVQQFLAPNPIAVQDNGRGIAVAGNTIYYTTANSGNIYVTNAITHADLGILVNTGLTGIASIAFDGTDLYVIPYNNGTGVFKYTTGGVLIGNLLPGFGGNSQDGFEIANNNIIMNRGDAIGPYDKYDLAGNLIQANFITPTFAPTGITFDGTNFFVSDIFNNAIATYDINGAFISHTTLGLPLPPTSSGRLIEDLSALGNVPDNPPPNAVPEPGTILLMGVGIAGAVFLRRRTKNAGV